MNSYVLSTHGTKASSSAPSPNYFVLYQISVCIYVFMALPIHLYIFDCTDLMMSYDCDYNHRTCDNKSMFHQVRCGDNSYTK